MGDVVLRMELERLLPGGITFEHSIESTPEIVLARKSLSYKTSGELVLRNSREFGKQRVGLDDLDIGQFPADNPSE